MTKYGMMWIGIFLMGLSQTPVFAQTEELGAPLGARKKSEASLDGSEQPAKDKKAATKEGASAPYTGPLRILITDWDYNVGSDAGRLFRVLRWREAMSPIFDVVNSGLPEYVDIPMRDWEYGVESDIPQYNMTPIKDLVGRYYNSSQTIKDPGNSYYDRPIKLSNGVLFNPRFYYTDPQVTYADFRTNLREGKKPLVESVKRMIETDDFGPMFGLFALAVNPELPMHVMVLTAAGNLQVEWDEAMDLMIKAGKLPAGSKIDRVYATNNPALTVNDAASASRFGRADASFKKQKLQILSYQIDTILNRRMDREFPESPRPNVIVFPEDNFEVLLAAKALFERKVNEVQDYDRNMNVARAPIRLILVNTLPEWYYAEMPNALRSNPQALSNKPIDLDKVMVFDSSYRYTKGQSNIRRIKAKDAVVTAVAEAFGVSEALAKQVIKGDAHCNVLLTGTKPKKGNES